MYLTRNCHVVTDPCYRKYPVIVAILKNKGHHVRTLNNEPACQSCLKTYISNTNRIQCGQLVDGQAVRVVPSSGKQCSGGIKFNSVDTTALLVHPGARTSCWMVMTACHHCTHHPRNSIRTLPVLQHGNACYLASLDISYKELQAQDRKDILFVLVRTVNGRCSCISITEGRCNDFQHGYFLEILLGELLPLTNKSTVDVYNCECLWWLLQHITCMIVFKGIF